MASYTVTSGDTLSSIARRYNTTVSALLQANPKLTTEPKYKNGKVIFSGTKIKLPDTGGTTTSVGGRGTDGGTINITPPTTSSSVITPSALASGESGAIGAISISSQMAAIAKAEEDARRAAEENAAAVAQQTEEERRQARMAQLKAEREQRMAEEAANRAKSDPMKDPTNRPAAPPEDDENIYYYGWIGGATSGEWRLYKQSKTTGTPAQISSAQSRSEAGQTQATFNSAVGANTLKPVQSTTTTPTTTTPTTVDYTGQIATRKVENGQVVFRLPDGTIVKESGVSEDGYFLYTLPDGREIKSGKLVPSSSYQGTPTTTTTTTPTTTVTPTATTTETTAVTPPIPTVQYYRNPTTGELILGPDGKPIVIGPGGSASDVFAYTEALRASTEAKQRAAIANTFARRQAQTALEQSQRSTGRDIFALQRKALNELARRGITSAPGLSVAARRSAGAVPLQRRLDALQQYQQSLTASDIMLADEQAKADEAQRNALVQLTQASNIANRLSGGNS